jgi:hypothetical protein
LADDKGAEARRLQIAWERAAAAQDAADKAAAKAKAEQLAQERRDRENRKNQAALPPPKRDRRTKD